MIKGIQRRKRRVALQFVSKMQLKAWKIFDALHIKIGLYQFLVLELLSLIRVKFILSLLVLCTKYLMTLNYPLQEKSKEMFENLISTVGGKDLLARLRMVSVQKIAIEISYTKLAGLFTSKIAYHVLAATVKEQGYSLAADIRYADLRPCWELWKILTCAVGTTAQGHRL